jgi:hypothetical protein
MSPPTRLERDEQRTERPVVAVAPATVTTVGRVRLQGGDGARKQMEGNR